MINFFVTLGILGFLQSKKVDAYLIGVNEFIDEPWLKKTVPFRTEEIGLGHEIHENVNIYDLMMNFNLGFKVFFFYFSTLLVSLLLFLVIKVVSSEATKIIPSEAVSSGFVTGFKSRKFSSLIGLFFNNHKLSIKLFLLFFGLFQWHARLFLTNGIKTNKASGSN